jgi:hypothetical protein
LYFTIPEKTATQSNSGVQGKNNKYHIVDKVQNSFIDALIFDLIDNVEICIVSESKKITEKILL